MTPRKRRIRSNCRLRQNYTRKDFRYSQLCKQASWPQRVLIVAVSIPIAILVNAARVAVTGVLAHRFGMEVASGFFHMLEGFGMFALAFVLMAACGFAIVRVLPSREAASGVSA